jgi:hypothetical protein
VACIVFRLILAFENKNRCSVPTCAAGVRIFECKPKGNSFGRTLYKISQLVTAHSCFEAEHTGRRHRERLIGLKDQASGLVACLNATDVMPRHFVQAVRAINGAQITRHVAASLVRSHRRQEMGTWEQNYQMARYMFCSLPWRPVSRF